MRGRVVRRRGRWRNRCEWRLFQGRKILLADLAIVDERNARLQDVDTLCLLQADEDRIPRRGQATMKRHHDLS